MKEPSLRCQRRDSPLLEKREKWGTPVSDWSELRDEPHNHRTLGEGGHPPPLASARAPAPESRGPILRCGSFALLSFHPPTRLTLLFLRL